MSTFMDRWLCTKYRYLDARADAFHEITATLELLNRPVTIVETGCVRQEGNWAGDGQSTLVWDAFVNHVGGSVLSVDIDPEAALLANSMTSGQSLVAAEDSVAWLHGLAQSGLHADFLYLDSYDINWDDPEPSQQHHQRELLAAWPLLAPGSLVAVDDNRDGIGKGYLVGLIADKYNWTPLVDGYVRAWVVN